MDAELRELCERLRGLLAKVPAGELTAADEKNNIGNGMTMHFSVVKRPDGKNIIRLGYTDPYVHLFAAAVNALPRLLDTIAAQAAELEGVREIAEVRTRTILELTTLLANVPGESVIECVRNLRASAEKAEAELEGVRKDAAKKALHAIAAQFDGMAQACYEEDEYTRRDIWREAAHQARKRTEHPDWIDTAIADSGAGGGA